MQLVEVDVSDIIPYENNPRKNEKAVMPVMKSIKQCGYDQPIIVDEDMIVLSGHTRLMAIKQLGWDKVQVGIIENLTEEQKKKYRLLDNKVSEAAGWDLWKLEQELQGLDFGDLALDWGLGLEEDSTEFVNKEYSTDSFGDDKFKYECPCCGFRFNE